MDAKYFAEESVSERAPLPMAVAPPKYDAVREPEPRADERAFDAHEWVTLRVMDAYN